jgi:3-isopropylmalate/(R)-2-methylmalate dehydratase small subunit
MERFLQLSSIGAPLMQINIDTDQIIPSRFLPRTHTPNGLGEGLLSEWRTLADGSPNPEFILNKKPWSEARILLAGRNFGCGSSREAAPKALRQCGFRAIIAASFGDIFYGNCFRNGIVPVILPEPVVQAMADTAMTLGETAFISVDLSDQTVKTAQGEIFHFESPARLRTMLFEGLDEIDLTLKMRTQIDAFRQRDEPQRSWAYGLAAVDPGAA